MQNSFHILIDFEIAEDKEVFLSDHSCRLSSSINQQLVVTLTQTRSFHFISFSLYRVKASINILPALQLALSAKQTDLQRRDLLAGIAELLRPFVQITNLSNDALIQLLLYGDQYLSYDLNRNILELTLRFIHETGRFD